MAGHSTGMDLAAILERVEERLRVVGLSADRASTLAKKPDAIRNLRRAVRTGDRKGVNAVTLGALAPVLETTVAWLIGTEAPMREPSRPVANVQTPKVHTYLLRGTVEKLGSNSILVDLDVLVQGLYATLREPKQGDQEVRDAALAFLGRLLSHSDADLERAEDLLARIASEPAGLRNRLGRGR